MNIDLVLIVAAVAVLAAIGTWLAARRRVELLAAQLGERVSQVHELEQTLHLVRRDGLEDANRLELKHHDDLRDARAIAFEEGRAVGRAERKSDHITEISTLSKAHAEELIRARERAAAEARDQLRAEYESKTKAFDIQISPYVEIIDLDSYFKKEEEVRIGYQYQLLVNGIPAFDPHITITKTERRKKSKDEKIDKLVALAQSATEAAVSVFLGGKGKLVTAGKAVVNRVSLAKKLLPRMPSSGRGSSKK